MVIYRSQPRTLEKGLLLAQGIYANRYAYRPGLRWTFTPQPTVGLHPTEKSWSTGVSQIGDEVVC